MLGGSGNDHFDVMGGNSRAFGGSGNDSFETGYRESGSYHRIFDGGSGQDKFGFRESELSWNYPLGYEVTLDGLANNGRLGEDDSDNIVFIEELGGSNRADFIDASMVSYGATVHANNGADTIRGSKSADELHGGLGGDSINGNAAEDRILGEDGDDTLVGGAGPDVINGGKGADRILADDNVADHVLGGTGLSDEADVDDGLDEVTGTEILT